MTPPLKLLYVMGFSRSGTTVLANALGSVPGFCTVGEMSSHLWEMVRGERPCGCGQPFRECEFWQAVLDESIGGLPSAEAAEALRATERRFLRTRHIPAYLRATPGDPGLDAELRRYLDTVAGIYRAAAARSDARVVVDASKRPADGAALRLAPGLDPYFVHVVRDPRAVAYSWKRKRQLGLAEFPPHRVAVLWDTINVLALYVSRWAGDRSILVRYEDFVRAPERTLAAIVRLTGEPAAELPVVDGDHLRLELHHTSGGNTRRSWDGVIELREDDEWRRSMPTRRRTLVTALAAPGLRRFDYPLRTAI